MMVYMIGMDNRYGITDTGLVYSYEKGRYLKPIIVGRYRYVRYFIEGTHYYAHVLVAAHFMETMPKGYVISHIDCNRMNNCVENLRYVKKTFSKLNTIDEKTFYDLKMPENIATLVNDKGTMRKMEAYNSSETLYFSSINDLLKHFRVSRMKIHRAIKEGKMINNYTIKYKTVCANR